MQSVTEIYVIGPSSTGKTTLCQALAGRLGLSGAAFVMEVARDVMKRDGFTRHDVGKLVMQAAIMEAQLAREREGRAVAANSSAHVLLSDRSAVDPIVYALLTSASEEEGGEPFQSMTDSPPFQLALSAYRRSVFVLLAPVQEWLVDDGIRNVEQRVESLVLFREVLEKLGISYREIGPEMKSLADRMNVVTNLAGL